LILVATPSTLSAFLHALDKWLAEAKTEGFEIRPRMDSLLGYNLRADDSVSGSFVLERRTSASARQFLSTFSERVHAPYRARLVREHHLEIVPTSKSSGADAQLEIAFHCHSPTRLHDAEKRKLRAMSETFRG